VKALAVIPARGGSKRVPGKNLKNLGGKPLVLWTVEAAQQAREIDRLVVSTEDPEIGMVCRNAGAEVLRRPSSLALDHIWSAPVVKHALETVALEGYHPEWVCLLHPTSPFRTGADIDACLTACRSWLGSVVSFTDDDLNGAIYVTRTAMFLAHGSFMQAPILPYTMDAVRGIDIDTPADFERAESYTREAA